MRVLERAELWARTRMYERAAAPPGGCTDAKSRQRRRETMREARRLERLRAAGLEANRRGDVFEACSFFEAAAMQAVNKDLMAC